MRGTDKTWHADLIEMLPYFRDRIPAIPIKSQSRKDVTELMKSILVQEKPPKNLHTNQAKSFTSQHLFS